MRTQGSVMLCWPQHLDIWVLTPRQAHCLTFQA